MARGEQARVGPHPVDIRIERAEQAGEGSVEIICGPEEQPLQLADFDGDDGWIDVADDDWNEPLVMLDRVIDFSRAHWRFRRYGAEYENYSMHAFDGAHDFLQPLGRGWYVFPVNPTIAASPGKRRVQPSDELLVLAGIRNEDVLHRRYPVLRKG